MIETEAKIRISKEDFDRFGELFSGGSTFLQENICFGFLGRFVRVRYEKGRTIFTYKGKRRKGKLNSRREIEFVSRRDLKSLIWFFDLFFRKVIYKKKRTNFNFMNCVVSLDYFDEKTIFIEVEGSSADVYSCLEKLGLDSSVIEKKSYYEIFRYRKV